MKQILIILFFSFSFIPFIQAQDADGGNRENLAAKATAANDTVLLRWAPSNAKAWMDGKKYGYVVTRFTAFKDGVFQQNPQEVIIPQTFLPQPLEKWEAHALASDYTAVIAQAFFGDEFLVHTEADNIGSIMNQSDELQQRFVTSVFMAEYDFEGASLAGWAYTDTNVKKDESYLYRIQINRPVPEQGDTAVVMADLSKQQALPQPIELNILCGDRSVMLSWNYFLQSDIYHSYLVERSSGSGFEQITDLPVTPFDAGAQEIFFTDSLSSNDTTYTYTYRVRGITSFGQLSPYSEEISGQGKEPVRCIPDIVSGEFIEKNKARINWTLDCENIDKLQKLEIKSSPSVNGEYTTLVDNINPQERTATFSLDASVSYLKVQAWTKDGDEMESFPYMLRQVDSIPPSIPTGLAVQIDSLGVAHISWNANAEADLRGYRLMRSFQEREEKSALSSRLITATEFADTLSLDNLNQYVYYSLSAVDLYYNESEPCPHVKAVKPDLSEPNAAVITSFSQDGNKITLNWVASQKDTTIRYDVFRTLDTEIIGETVLLGNNTVRTFTDEVEKSGRYTYSVIAVSPNGKTAASAQNPSFNVTVKEETDVISGLTCYKNERDNYIELSWKKHPEAVSYILYKKENDKPMALLKELDAGQNRFVDEMVSPASSYTYMIVYSTRSGQKSKPKSISVKH